MATKIPLKCDICPKKPRFSDVSHLLTHISSKTHLSNIFKAKVRADADTESRRLIEDYDQWYAEWNIHDLLAERMSMKEKKHVKSKPRVNRASTPASTSRSVRSNLAMDASTIGDQQSHTRHVQNVDPDLIARAPASQLPPLFGHIPYQFPQPSAQQGYNGLSVFRPYRQSSYQSTSIASQMHITRGMAPPQPSYNYPDPSDAHNGSQPTINTYTAPITRKRKATAGTGAHFLRSAVRRVKEEDASYEPTEVSATVESEEDEDDDSKPLSLEPDPEIDAITIDGDPYPNLTVKGIYWSGMGCFDSADPKKRSQRNQKKTDQSYQALQRFSEIVADNPYDSVYEVSKAGVWTVLKCRLITGNPSPSSLIGSSPAPSRHESPRKRPRNAAVLRQRYVNQQAIEGDSNSRTEYDLQQAILGLRRGRTLSVFNDTEDDADTRSNYTHPHKPSPPIHSFSRPKVSLNKENERTMKQKSAVPTKMHENGATSSIQIPHNSTEQRGYVDEGASYGGSQGGRASECEVSQTELGGAAQHGANFFRHSNHQPGQVPNNAKGFDGSNTSHQREPVRLTGTPSDYLIPGGAIRDHGYVSNFHSAAPTANSIQDVHSRFTEGQYNNANNYRLNNLATVAQNHLQYPQSGPSAYQFSPSPYGRPISAFPGYSHGATVAYNSTMNYGPSIDGSWTSQPSAAPVFPPAAFHLRRTSAQMMGMPHYSPSTVRAPDFTSPHNHQMNSTDEKPSVWTDSSHGTHGSPTHLTAGNNQTPQPLGEPFIWAFDRIHGSSLHYPETFTMPNMFENHANQGSDVHQSNANAQPPAILPFLAPIRCEGAAPGSATPTGGTMGLPAVPGGSSGRQTRANSSATITTPLRERLQAGSVTSRASDRDHSPTGSCASKSASSPQELPNVVVRSNEMTPGDGKSTVLSDDDRTVTAPRTPSKGGITNCQ